MPDSIIKTARDFRNFFEEKMFMQFVFHITFYENLLPNIQKCMCLEELGGEKKINNCMKHSIDKDERNDISYNNIPTST